MASDTVYSRLRIPRDLHDELKRGARLNERSLNGEIVYRLRQRSAASQSGPQKTAPHYEGV